MENNIELFDLYIDGSLSPEESRQFEDRLASDRDLAADFRIYLLTVLGVCQEAEQDNIEFGHAMKRISGDELLRITGSRRRRRLLPHVRERLLWTASIAAVLAIGIFSTLRIHQAGMDRMDDVIVAYNYVPTPDRSADGGYDERQTGDITPEDIPALEKAYRSVPADDLQAREDAGMRLAMAYLQLHDRNKAREVLTEMTQTFADDPEFAAQCEKILELLK